MRDELLYLLKMDAYLEGEITLSSGKKSFAELKYD